ncbi:MAG: four helix bundle protein [Candidatus Moranbacteria bacterium]|nr:four helix bundle protein [Candidatus Moranbacteria bacterium]
MLKPSRQPYGFKNLLAYKKAEELQMGCSLVTAQFPKYKTLIALADQMDRSARSGKQNIVEGWKRNSTKEYYDFLGFSIGANTELEEDCNDIWRGVYPDLIGITGVMGEKGKMGGDEMGEMGEGGKIKRDEISITREKGNGVSLSTPFDPLIPLDIEKIPFYPLNKNLPPIIQLKLRCKELNYLLNQLQKSLEAKMLQEKTLSGGDIARNYLQAIDKNKKQDDIFLEQYGFVRLENGQVIAKNQDG